jgi:hypothetical protein
MTKKYLSALCAFFMLGEAKGAAIGDFEWASANVRPTLSARATTVDQRIGAIQPQFPNDALRYQAFMSSIRQGSAYTAPSQTTSFLQDITVNSDQRTAKTLSRQVCGEHHESKSFQYNEAHAWVNNRKYALELDPNRDPSIIVPIRSNVKDDSHTGAYFIPVIGQIMLAVDTIGDIRLYSASIDYNHHNHLLQNCNNIRTENASLATMVVALTALKTDVDQESIRQQQAAVQYYYQPAYYAPVVQQRASQVVDEQKQQDINAAALQNLHRGNNASAAAPIQNQNRRF